MAVNIPAAIFFAIAGAGVGEGISALSGSGKSSVPGLPAIPSMASASDTSQEAQKQQRRSALIAGSQTNITGGSGIVLGSDVNSVTLVGSN